MKDIQRNILAIAILYEKEQCKIFKYLDIKHFTGEYRTIFKEMKSIYINNKNIDPLVISERLGHEYSTIIAELSGIDYIRPNTKEYIDLLIDDYQRREAERQIKSLLPKLADKSQSIKSIKNSLLDTTKIFENNNDLRYRTYSLKDTLVEIYNEQEKEAQFINTGFKKLDEHVLMDKSKLIILGGRPSSGKTTLSSSIALNMSKDNKVLFFSLETNYKGIGEKMIAAHGKIPYLHIIRHTMSLEEKTRYKATLEELKEYRLGIVQAAGYSVEEIREKVLQEKADVIVIDYLQQLFDEGRSNYERVTNISRKLQALAKQENILIIALSQLKRAEPGTRRPPTMSDLRESGQLEQDADAILLLYDEMADDKSRDIEKQERILTIGKNKTGRLGDIKYDFYGRTQLFCEA